MRATSALLLAVLAVFLAVPCAAVQPGQQVDTLRYQSLPDASFAGWADSWIRGAAAQDSANGGGLDSMRIGQGTGAASFAYLRVFSWGAYIPATARIDSSKMVLHYRATVVDTLMAYLSLLPWVEGSGNLDGAYPIPADSLGITYLAYNRLAGADSNWALTAGDRADSLLVVTPWESQLEMGALTFDGVGVARRDRSPYPVFTKAYPTDASAGYMTIDITDIFRAWHEGRLTNYGVRIGERNTTTSNVTFDTKEHATAANRPMVIVWWRPGEATTAVNLVRGSRR